MHVLDGEVRVVDVAPLTRELLLHAVARAPLHLSTPGEQATTTLLADRLRAEPTAALRLPLPADPRARGLADRLLADPAQTLDQAISGLGVSRRTVERAYPTETHLTLAAWHRRARILAAVDLITAGVTVTHAATTVGYATSSSLSHAFRTELGTPPPVRPASSGRQALRHTATRRRVTRAARDIRPADTPCRGRCRVRMRG